MLSLRVRGKGEDSRREREESCHDYVNQGEEDGGRCGDLLVHSTKEGKKKNAGQEVDKETGKPLHSYLQTKHPEKRKKDFTFWFYRQKEQEILIVLTYKMIVCYINNLEIYKR